MKKKEKDTLENSNNDQGEMALADDNNVNIDDDSNEDDNPEKMRASEVRRKIEDYLERRNFINELGEEFVGDDLDWATD